MLRVMHRFQKHVLWVVLVGAVGLAMTGFGVNVYSNRSSPEVAMVNGLKISGEQLVTEMRGIENQYRQIFGERSSELMKNFGVNVESQAIDQLIDKTLWNQESESYGLVAPAQEVERIVREQLAAAQFDAGRFRTFLSQMGMTEEAFIKELGNELQRTALQRAVADAIAPARLEIKRKHARDGAKVLQWQLLYQKRF
jgi:SurA N-terminal domain